MYRRALSGWVIWAWLLGAAAPGWAAEGDSEEASEATSYSSVVVQNRRHDPTHEFTASVGVLPMDAFAKGITASGSYTLHFTPHVGWEALHFFHSFQVKTQLSDKLQSFDVEPTPFEVLNTYVTSNFVFKPLYWKGSWLNTGVTRGELLLTAGGAYGWFTRSNRPGFSVGTGFRLFTSKLLSFRLDTRYLAFAGGFGDAGLDIEDELWIGLGTSISF